MRCVGSGIVALPTTDVAIGIGIIVALAAVPLLNPGTYVLSFLFTMFMYGALAGSWNIIGGYAGYLSFGHAAFFGVGAYTTALLLFYFGWSPFLTMPLAGGTAALFAALVGYPCLRLRGPYFSLVTLILGLAMYSLVLNLPFTQGSTGLFLPFLRVDISTSHIIFYEVMLALLVLATVTLRQITRTKMGIGLAAIREDEDAAGTLGVNATRLKLQAFMLSAFLTGLVGGLYSYYKSYLDPSFVFATSISITIVLMALFGGRLTWYGPLVGAVVLSVINEILTTQAPPQTARIVFGALLIGVILFLPDGLMSIVQRRLAALPVRQAHQSSVRDRVS
ncbi:branched-chain amino acid ABC transporter permease [Roseiflexus sp.]|uniref:branched-chain amino acid ABC transporter permease n=1 Tax=Roseiflexus sp. TaxID=2562120 RepID=UPI00398ACC0D